MATKNIGNSSDLAYERDMFMLNFTGGCAAANIYLSPKEYDDSISEIESMIAYAVYRGDEEDVRFWRSMLQRTKVEKRRAKMNFLRKELYA